MSVAAAGMSVAAAGTSVLQQGHLQPCQTLTLFWGQNTRTVHWWHPWSLENPQNSRRLPHWCHLNAATRWCLWTLFWGQNTRAVLEYSKNSRRFPHWCQLNAATRWCQWTLFWGQNNRAVLENPQNSRRLRPWSHSCRCLRLNSGRCPQSGRTSLHLGRWSDWMREDNQLVNQSLSIN